MRACLWACACAWAWVGGWGGGDGWGWAVSKKLLEGSWTSSGPARTSYALLQALAEPTTPDAAAFPTRAWGERACVPVWVAWVGCVGVVGVGV